MMDGSIYISHSLILQFTAHTQTLLILTQSHVVHTNHIHTLHNKKKIKM